MSCLPKYFLHLVHYLYTMDYQQILYYSGLIILELYAQKQAQESHISPSAANHIFSTYVWERMFPREKVQECDILIRLIRRYRITDEKRKGSQPGLLQLSSQRFFDANVHIPCVLRQVVKMLGWTSCSRVQKEPTPDNLLPERKKAAQLEKEMVSSLGLEA